MTAPRAEDTQMNANSDKDYIDAKTDSIRAGMDGALGAFEANVNSKFAEVNGRFAEVNGKFAEVNGKFATLDATIAQVRTEIKESAERMTSQMVKWMVGIFVATLTIFFQLDGVFAEYRDSKVAGSASASAATDRHPTAADAGGTGKTLIKGAGDERQFR
jgi:hypothetical protein